MKFSSGGRRVEYASMHSSNSCVWSLLNSVFILWDCLADELGVAIADETSCDEIYNLWDYVLQSTTIILFKCKDCTCNRHWIRWSKSAYGCPASDANSLHNPAGKRGVVMVKISHSSGMTLDIMPLTQVAGQFVRCAKSRENGVAL